MTMSLCLYVSMSQCLFAYIYLSNYLSFHCVSTYLSIAYRPIFPSIYLSIYFTICHFFRLSIDLSFFLSIDLCIYVSIYLSAIYLSICLPNLSIHLSIYPSIHLSIYPSIDLSIYLSTSHCKLHTSHWARNAQRCISHSAYWTLQVKTIHCKHYSPRHAHSTHQSPHSARQMQTRHSTCLPPHSTHSSITHTQRKSARWRKVPNKYVKVGQG